MFNRPMCYVKIRQLILVSCHVCHACHLMGWFVCNITGYKEVDFCDRASGVYPSLAGRASDSFWDFLGNYLTEAL